MSSGGGSVVVCGYEGIPDGYDWLEQEGGEGGRQSLEAQRSSTVLSGRITQARPRWLTALWAASGVPTREQAERAKAPTTQSTCGERAAISSLLLLPPFTGAARRVSEVRSDALVCVERAEGVAL